MRIAVVGIWLALMLLAWFEWPELSYGQTEDRCAMDLHADIDEETGTRQGYIDIFDTIELAARFGLAVPPEPEMYDIYPELEGDGYIDIFDIIQVTNYFGGQCFGITATEVMTDAAAVSASVFECEYRGYSWLAARTPTHVVIGGYLNGTWYGKTICYGYGHVWEYDTSCQFGIYVPNGPTQWSPIAATELGDMNGLMCGANGYSVAFVPKCQPFKFGMQHAVEHYGQQIHSDYHLNDDHYVIC